MEPSIEIYPAYGGHLVTLDGERHVVTDIEHLLRLVRDHLEKIDEQDSTTVDERLRDRRRKVKK